MIRSVFFLAIISISINQSFSQGIPIGAWRHHLPTNRIIHITEDNNRVFGATQYGLVVYNKNENSVSLINKVHGLSDFGISYLEYFENHDILFIGYQNGNIDVIKQGFIYNIPDIRQTTAILGSKRINKASDFTNEDILVATDFGIVQLNTNHLVIKNTFYIGEEGSVLQVNDILVHEETIYAASSFGILHADVSNPNLSDFNSWEPLEDEPVFQGMCKKVFIAFGKMFLWYNADDFDIIFYNDNDSWTPFGVGEDNYLDTKNGMGYSQNNLWIATSESLDIFNSQLELIETITSYHYGNARPNDAFFDDQGVLWIADSNIGIVRKNTDGQFSNFLPAAPLAATSNALGASPGVVWLAPGSISTGGINTWNYSGALFFTDERWHIATRFNIEALEGVFDIYRVVPDPGNNKQAYFSSWSRGLIRLTTEMGFTLYDETNSTLQLRAGLDDQVRIGGAAFDKSRNLWVTNSEVTKPISVMLNNGEWLAFDSKGLVQPNQLVGKIIVDNSNQKWIILPGNGVLVFKENTLENNNDFQVRKLSTQTGNGSLPSNYVYSMAVDQSGYVWVGTQKGVSVFYSPHGAFSGEPFDSQQPIVQQDAFAGLLLENDQINSIAIDGGNNKWFGTSRSGAFFMSPDARNTYLHFTTDNSPLPSNNILDIAIEPQTGEVFFATDKGLASFRNYATAGGAKHEDVYAYPNPVKPGYEGYIAIKGLVRNAFIKITDINGNLVYETRAQGGQAIWNGRDLYGNKPSSGVYVVFSANEDGSETAVTKILFIR